MFEEFYNSLPIKEMLVYLDGYPIALPCRYADKVACYTKVYILSNIDLKDQYLEIQTYTPEVWRAFLRRIQTVQVFKSGKVANYNLLDYMYEFQMMTAEQTSLCPFKEEMSDGKETTHHKRNL